MFAVGDADNPPPHPKLHIKTGWRPDPAEIDPESVLEAIAHFI